MANNFYLTGSDNPIMSMDGELTTEEIIAQAKALEAKRVAMEKQLESLRNKEAVKTSTPVERNTQANKSLWKMIDDEVMPLSDNQYKILISDKDYANNAQILQSYITEAIHSLAMPIVENMPKGKALLEAQLNLVKSKKQAVIAESNKELETLKRFQIASAANANLTYSEFLKIDNKEEAVNENK